MSLKLTFSHLKTDGWKMSFLLGQKAYFQGRAVSFREGKIPIPRKSKPTKLCPSGSGVFFYLGIILNTSHFVWFWISRVEVAPLTINILNTIILKLWKMIFLCKLVGDFQVPY